jgi:hypothetical protein
MFESEGKNITTLMGWAASLNRDEELPKFWRTTFQSKNESALDPVKSRARPCLWRGKGHECLYRLIMLHPAAPGRRTISFHSPRQPVRYIYLTGCTGVFWNGYVCTAPKSTRDTPFWQLKSKA